jgi:NADH:ubiquinone oxidoreductase subunit
MDVERPLALTRSREWPAIAPLSREWPPSSSLGVNGGLAHARPEGSLALLGRRGTANADGDPGARSASGRSF